MLPYHHKEKKLESLEQWIDQQQHWSAQKKKAANELRHFYERNGLNPFTLSQWRTWSAEWDIEESKGETVATSQKYVAAQALSGALGSLQDKVEDINRAVHACEAIHHQLGTESENANAGLDLIKDAARTLNDGILTMHRYRYHLELEAQHESPQQGENQ